MAKYYPTTPKNKKINFGGLIRKIDFDLSQQNSETYAPLAKIHDKSPFKDEFKKFCDEFINPVANIGVNNSLMQYGEFIDNRIGYSEMAFLRNQPYINNAIQAYANDLIDKKGDFKIIDEVEDADFVLKELEKALLKIGFWDKLKKACDCAFTFGGALVFIDTNTDDYNLPLYRKFETMIKNPLQDLKVIEPYLASPYEVNTINPLNSDYMRPKKWYISGGGVVDSSRIETLIFNEAPDLIKPIYNFLGISKVQEMKEAVKIADSLNNSNAEIALRFRTMIIKTPLLQTNDDEAIARAKFNNKTKNNLGTLLLSDNEDYIETITPLSGLDRIQDLALQNVVASAYIPRNKLLGDEPSGFSSGEFTIKNYYDTIESIQNTILKPFLLKLSQMILYSIGYNYELDFDFAPVAQENAKEKAERENLLTDKIVKLYTNSIIDGEQAFSIAKSDNLVLENETFAFGEDLEPSEAEAEQLVDTILNPKKL